MRRLQVTIWDKWFASLPSAKDFSWGFQASLSSGTHSRIFRVFDIS
jgi:hypothetical protein